MSKLNPISEQVFKNKVQVRFNNINEGFSTYKNFNITSELEKEFIDFIEKIYDLNGEEEAYVDFYFNRLTEEDRLKLEEMITQEDKTFLEKLKGDNLGGDIYFKFRKEAIPFLTRLCTKEILFSTFYFTKYPCTIWGNYNMKFPMFFKDTRNMEIYKNMASLCGLKILI